MNKSIIDQMKKNVYESNLLLPKLNLVKLTWGNVSLIDRKEGVIVIKPSGIDYDKMVATEMVVVDLNGTPLDNQLRPSSDLPTHIELYKAFPDIKGICHTHSTYAVSWAQAGRDIPILGTTHADTFYGDIPCTRPLMNSEVINDYEKNTGVVICETFKKRVIDYKSIPAVIVNGHGPFTWGESSQEAVHHSLILEEVSLMNYLTLQINKNPTKLDKVIQDKHYYRKHGEDAYYGQA